MTEVLTKSDDIVAKYRESGGILDEESLEQAKAARLEITNGKKRQVNKNSLAQVKNMMAIIHAPITSLQEHLYAVLREMPKNTGGESNSPVESPKTVAARTLCDQALLMEALLLTGDTEEYNRLKTTYPNIFPDENNLNPPYSTKVKAYPLLSIRPVLPIR